MTPAESNRAMTTQDPRMHAALKSAGAFLLLMIIPILYVLPNPSHSPSVMSLKIAGAILIVLGAIIAGLVGWFTGSQMQAFAHKHGWAFSVDEGPPIHSTLTRFPFRQGLRSNVAWGKWKGYAAERFHWLELGLTSSEQPFWIELIILPASLPPVQVIPRSSKQFGVEHGEDVRFESADFDARWRVLCDDPRYAHDVLHPRMLERFLLPDTAGVPVTIEGGSIYSWSGGARPKTRDVPRRLDLLADVADLIPAHVVRQYGGYNPDAPPTTTPSPFSRGSRDRNWLARTAVLLSLGTFTAFVGIFVARQALKQARAGLATNLRLAQAAVVLNILMIGFCLWITGLTVIELT